MSKLHVRCDRQLGFFCLSSWLQLSAAVTLTIKHHHRQPVHVRCFKAPPGQADVNPRRRGREGGDPDLCLHFFEEPVSFLFSGTLPHADDRTIVHIFILTRMQPLLHCCCCAVTEPGSQNKTSRQNSMHLTTYGPTIKAAMSSLIEKYV